uniref:Uncharacterized protein n=1 Tax=Zea mays TaxID=4577 RepID=B6T6W3_MAIZE|nr:hypothetical protein [Zea mays]
MSLCTIARRLCLSKPSSGSRLSAIWAHLYSTEAAKDMGAKKYKYPDVYDPYGPMPPPSEAIIAKIKAAGGVAVME